MLLRTNSKSPLDEKTISIIIEDFKTQAKIDELGRKMKFLEKLKEIVIEVQLAKQALEDKTEEGITHKLKFAKKRRKSLFYFHNINPPKLHTPVYLSPIDRIVPIEFNLKTYGSKDFYKLIARVSDNLYSEDDDMLELLRKKHTEHCAISEEKIKWFEDRVQNYRSWQTFLDEDIARIENSKHYKIHLYEAQLKQCNADIKALS